jgi:hypothetical protein
LAPAASLTRGSGPACTAETACAIIVRRELRLFESRTLPDAQGWNYVH